MTTEIDIKTLTKAQRDKLRKQLEECREDWPQNGDEYWSLSREGSIYLTTWLDDRVDKLKLYRDEVFNTRAEAEYHLKMLELAYSIRQQADEVDWTSYGEVKFQPYFDHTRKAIKFTEFFAHQDRRIAFLTEEKARQAFEGVSNEDFLYMLNRGLL